MKKIITVLLLSTILLSACETGSPFNQGAHSSDEDSFINLDDYEKTGTATSTEFEYTEADLSELAKQKSRTDYVEVVKQFVESELGSRLRFIDSVDGTYNPKMITVGTATGEVYAVELNRWHNFGGIWTVRRYSQYGVDEGLSRSDSTVQYAMLELEQAEKAVQDWANKLLNTNRRSQDYLIINEELYILLTAAEGESVELIDIIGDDNRIIISHANSVVDSEQKYGHKPYVLIEVHSPVTEVRFNQYSSLEIAHPSLYTP